VADRERKRLKSTPSSLEGVHVSTVVWLPEELHQRLKRAAKIDGRTMRGFIRFAIQDKVASIETKAK
jgi:predicted DNA-binding protein